MSYIITTKKGSRLSYWYSGDLQSRRHIVGSRKNDWFAFESEERAREYIKNKLEEIPREQERWGEEITRQVKKYLNNLIIVKE